MIGSALAVPQFTATPPIEEIALFDGDVSIEAQDGSIEAGDAMPERNDEGFYRVDDMFLDEAQYKINFGTEEERQVIPDKAYKWPKGIVPYMMTSSVPADRKTKIRAAIAVMNKAFANCITIK